MTTLFDPITIGDLRLPNRIIMAPLTRSRAVGGGRVPNALMAQYYVQRASAGLILSEATAVTPQGVGYADTPGIWSGEQVEGWKLVTKAVHDAGGLIFLQLWHVGRISDPSFLDGAAPVAPSAIAAKGHVSLLRPLRSYPVPARWRSMKSPASSPLTARALKTPGWPASMASKSTAPMATCSTSSCRTPATTAPAATAVQSRTAPA